MSNIPADLLYTASHEWVKVEGDIATIGITDFAQAELGDVVYCDLPDAGRVLAQDEIFGSVESVKAVSDLYAPVAGEVVDTNSTLTQASETVNIDPYDAGWMIKIRFTALPEGLLNATQYADVAK
ncbi:MAG TPA: glycine cleavage system protein GcvH [Fimbriimonas sp.]|nr:glycine cleavage system protein GcvH [Fimbriimonas sp.]